MRTGRGEFLAELRPAIPVFVRFGGIDYDHDDDAIAQARRVRPGGAAGHERLRRQRPAADPRRQGRLPVRRVRIAARPRGRRRPRRRRGARAARPREDDGRPRDPGRHRPGPAPQRHVRPRDAADVRLPRRRGQPRRAADVGGAARSDLRRAAPSARPRARRSSGSGCRTSRSRARPIRSRSGRSTARWSGRRAARRGSSWGSWAGRRELAKLEASWPRRSADGDAWSASPPRPAWASRASSPSSCGTPGAAGHTVAFGECQAYGTRTPYFVWREIWRRLFGLEDEDPGPRSSWRRSASALRPSTRAWWRARRCSATWWACRSPTRTSRAASTPSCARHRSRTSWPPASGRGPRRRHSSAVLEDCHWIDELSRDLLEVAGPGGGCTPGPVRACLPARRRSPPEGSGSDGAAGFSELALDRMDPDDIAKLVRSKMEQLAGGEAAVSDALVDLVATRSDGNPFYVEELLNYIVAQGVDASDPVEVENVTPPGEPPHARPEPYRRRGRRSAAHAQGRQRRRSRLRGRPSCRAPTRSSGRSTPWLANLETLRTLDLVALDREAEQAWMFKHVVTQEVAYESLPFALRAVLHGRVGDYLEAPAAGDLDRLVPLLEHHYWRSDREEKKREYLRRAAAAAQAAVRQHRRDRLLRPPHPAARGRGAGRGDAQARPGPPSHRRDAARGAGRG